MASKREISAIVDTVTSLRLVCHGLVGSKCHAAKTSVHRAGKRVRVLSRRESLERRRSKRNINPRYIRRCSEGEREREREREKFASGVRHRQEIAYLRHLALSHARALFHV